MFPAALLGCFFAAACGSSSATTNEHEYPPDATTARREEGGVGGFGDGDAGAPCEGLRCQQAACSGGKQTTLTGIVYAPNGTLPLFNVIVYVPSSKPAPLAKGATCDKCGVVTGDPIVTTLTDSRGRFELTNVPAGKDIPVVLQIGKWRRQITIPSITACTTTTLTDPETTRLPKKRSEGDMPQIALTTGGCDKLGCMLPKVGIDASEFGVESDGPTKAVHTYIGAVPKVSAGGPPGATRAEALWGSLETLKRYDLAILSCECDEKLENKGGSANGAPFGAMTEYLELGGRIFTTDFMYTWYRYSTEASLRSAVSWRGGAPGGGSPMIFDSTFPKGQALVEWLSAVGATPPADPGKLKPDVVYANVRSTDPAMALTWATSENPNAGTRVFTTNVPAGLPAEKQCGKGVHIDAHINQLGSDKVDATYPAGCNSALKPGENLLAFFFFDVASCIQNESAPPKPPSLR